MRVVNFTFKIRFTLIGKYFKLSFDFIIGIFIALLKSQFISRKILFIPVDAISEKSRTLRIEYNNKIMYIYMNKIKKVTGRNIQAILQTHRNQRNKCGA